MFLILFSWALPRIIGCISLIGSVSVRLEVVSKNRRPFFLSIIILCKCFIFWRILRGINCLAKDEIIIVCARVRLHNMMRNVPKKIYTVERQVLKEMGAKNTVFGVWGLKRFLAIGTISSKVEPV